MRFFKIHSHSGSHFGQNCSSVLLTRTLNRSHGQVCAFVRMRATRIKKGLPTGQADSQAPEKAFLESLKTMWQSTFVITEGVSEYVVLFKMLCCGSPVEMMYRA